MLELSAGNADAGPPPRTRQGESTPPFALDHSPVGYREYEQAARQFEAERQERRVRHFCTILGQFLSGFGALFHRVIFCANWTDRRMCRDATFRLAKMTTAQKAARSRGRRVRKSYCRISYSAENMSSIGSRRNCENPASATSSRAFGSPMHAPIPAPPCASDTVMQ